MVQPPTTDPCKNALGLGYADPTMDLPHFDALLRHDAILSKADQAVEKGCTEMGEEREEEQMSEIGVRGSQPRTQRDVVWQDRG